MIIDFKNHMMSITYSQDDSKFSAKSCEDNSLQAFGNSIEEACKNLKEIINLKKNGNIRYD